MMTLGEVTEKCYNYIEDSYGGTVYKPDYGKDDAIIDFVYDDCYFSVYIYEYKHKIYVSVTLIDVRDVRIQSSKTEVYSTDTYQIESEQDIEKCILDSICTDRIDRIKEVLDTIDDLSDSLEDWQYDLLKELI